MSSPDAVHDLLASLTPGRLRALILDLIEAQPADLRTHVNLLAVMDTLTEGHDLGSGARGWTAQLTLKRALVDMLASVPDLAYVEGDA